MASPKTERILNIVFVFALALVLLSKFFLIYEDEIIARYSPNDNSWFIRAASFLMKGEWLGPYDGRTLIRPPGYPLAIWWNHSTGLPLRLAHELWLMAAALYFAFSFSLPKYSRTLRWLFTAVIVFHPTTFLVGREAEGENFYLPIYLVFIGALVRHFYAATPAARLRYSLLAGVSLGLLAVTREESQLLLGVGATFAVLLWLSLGSEGRKQRVQAVFGAVLIPLACYAGSIQALKGMNSRRYGVAVFSERNSPGMSRFYQALQKIQESPSPRYVSVTRATRNRAYQVSPTFRQIRGLLEGDFGEFWRKVGCRMGADCDDLSSGWIGAAVMDSVAQMGFAKTSDDADAFFGRAAEEIEAACRRGALKCDGPTGGNVDFIYRTLRWSYFWGSLKKIGGMLAPIKPFPQPVDESRPDVVELYDRVANRRPPRPSYFQRSGEVVGWAYGSDPITRIEAIGPGDRVYGKTEAFFEREDATRRLETAGLAKGSTPAGFKLKFDIDSGAVLPLQLQWVQASGRTLRKPMRPFYEELPDWILSVETINGAEASWRIRLERGMAKAYRWLLAASSVLAALTLLLFPFLKKRPAPSHYWPVLILLFSAVVSRFFPLVLLDAVFYPIIEIALRYTYPIVGIYACLTIWILLGLIPSMFKAGENTPRSLFPTP